MKIKICGLYRNEDIDYINEARPDYAGFVFAESRRQVSPEQAAGLRQKLSSDIGSVGVFVNALPETICALYRDGVINMAQLHGSEDGEYIKRLKDLCDIQVIKTIKVNSRQDASLRDMYEVSDYYMFDSGAGSGKTFNWDLLEPQKIDIPWFLAGGIRLDNIKKAIELNPYAIDISSGAETDGVKDREKILQLTVMVRKGNTI